MIPNIKDINLFNETGFKTLTMNLKTEKTF